jgi:hypothetical protein
MRLSEHPPRDAAAVIDPRRTASRRAAAQQVTWNNPTALPSVSFQSPIT